MLSTRLPVPVRGTKPARNLGYLPPLDTHSGSLQRNDDCKIDRHRRTTVRGIFPTFISSLAFLFLRYDIYYHHKLIHFIGEKQKLRLESLARIVATLPSKGPPNRSEPLLQHPQDSLYEPNPTETGDPATQVAQVDQTRSQHGQPASTSTELTRPSSSTEGFLPSLEIDSQIAFPEEDDWDSIIQDIGSGFSAIDQSISPSKDLNYSAVNTGSARLAPLEYTPPFQVQHIRHLLMLNDDEEAGHHSEAIIGSAFTLSDIVRAGVKSLALNTSNIPHGRHPDLVYEPRNTDNVVDSGSGSGYLHPQDYHPVPRSSNSLPDPLRNHIRINQLALKAACLTNASLLGVAADRVLTRRCRSPFYLPDQDVEATRAIFVDTKQDLRPCPSQIFNDHHIYIDLIPFPVFRDRVLALRATSPPILDEIELMQDLDKDGLICWGSSAGIGSGTPWDMRSWEVRPWFLRKWWMLCGGPEGQMSSQSRWWCEMRGEEFEYPS